MIEEKIDFKGKWVPIMGTEGGRYQQKGVYIILTVSLKQESACVHRIHIYPKSVHSGVELCFFCLYNKKAKSTSFFLTFETFPQ